MNYAWKEREPAFKRDILAVSIVIFDTGKRVIFTGNLDAILRRNGITLTPSVLARVLKKLDENGLISQKVHGEAEKRHRAKSFVVNDTFSLEAVRESLEAPT